MDTNTAVVIVTIAFCAVYVFTIWIMFKGD